MGQLRSTGQETVQQMSHDSGVSVQDNSPDSVTEDIDQPDIVRDVLKARAQRSAATLNTSSDTSQHNLNPSQEIKVSKMQTLCRGIQLPHCGSANKERNQNMRNKMSRNQMKNNTHKRGTNGSFIPHVGKHESSIIPFSDQAAQLGFQEFSTTERQHTSHASHGKVNIISATSGNRDGNSSKTTSAKSTRSNERLEIGMVPAYPEIIDAYARISRYDENLDLQFKQQAYDLLLKSGCYYGPLTMSDARLKLKKSEIGTYLLRDTSDSNYFLALSVKTDRGTTSIRIAYNRGRFRLDCEESARLKMPSFDCVMKLIQHYTDVTTHDKNQNKCVFLESTGRKDTPVLLRKPYKEKPKSLKHMCRLTLNQLLSEDQRSRLLIFMPPDIEKYMQGYPYLI